jgi:hypothetical protein
MVAGHMVDELAHDIEVASVSRRLLDHVDQHRGQRHRATEPCGAGLVELQLVDDLMRRGTGSRGRPRPSHPGLTRRSAFSSSSSKGGGFGHAAGGMAEPAVLDRRQMLHEDRQVGARPCHRPSQVGVSEPFEFLQHRGAMPVQADAQTLRLLAGERRTSRHALCVHRIGIGRASRRTVPAHRIPSVRGPELPAAAHSENHLPTSLAVAS